ncbi:ABC transporter permease [Tundrisphaera lichenicola]|uniref:ABC transporter permease n=1 Tax=Tundrisphaera lichenicola TaxID=2029860 RepID=UPI003EB741AC
MRGPIRSLPVIVALILIVGWPMAATIREATRPGDDSGPGSGELVATARPGEIARPIGLAFETIRLVLATGAIALPMGMALAFILCRTDVWGRRGMLFAVGLSAFVPVPLIATAWLGGLGNAGRLQVLGGSPWLVGWSGAAFIHAVACLPWVVAIMGVGLRGVEPELEESARLDLSPWGVILRVTLRRSLGALAASALAVAVLTGGDMTVTDLLSVRTYAEEAYTQYQSGNSPRAAAVALPPMILLGVLVLLGARALLKADPARVLSASTRARDWRLGRWRVPVGLGLIATAGNLLALPLYSLIWHAGRVGGAPGREPSWSVQGLAGTLANAAREMYSPGFARPIRSPLLSSLILAGAGALVTVALAWSLAWLARRPGIWRWVVALTVAVTLALPGPVAGMALVVAYFDWPSIYGSPALLILAYILRTLPYALVVLWPAVRSIPPAFLELATLEGYGAWGQARRVAIPLTSGAIAAAWGVSFALAMGELPASNLVSPPGTMPLAVLVWTLLHRGVESHLAGVGLVTLAVLGLAGSVAAWGLSRVYGKAGPLS